MRNNPTENICAYITLPDLLNENVMQHILSFTNKTSTSLVCKRFDILCKKIIIQTKKQFLIENKHSDNDIEHAYQLTIKQSMIKCEKQMKEITKLQQQIHKKKWNLFEKLHNIDKPVKYVKLTNINNFDPNASEIQTQMQLPPFPTKVVIGCNTEHITYAGYGDLRKKHMKSYLISEDYIEEECSSDNIGFVKRLQTKELKSGDKIILTSGNYTDL